MLNFEEQALLVAYSEWEKLSYARFVKSYYDNKLGPNWHVPYTKWSKFLEKTILVYPERTVRNGRFWKFANKLL